MMPFKELIVLTTTALCLAHQQDDFELHTKKGDAYTPEQWARFSEGAIDLEGQELVDYINRHQDLWHASLPEETFPLMSMPLAGDDDDETGEKAAPKKTLANFTSSDPLPVSFDPRELHSECRDLIGTARDQFCGNCWAYAVTGAIADRLCVQTNGSRAEQLSVIDLGNCCRECNPNSTTGGCEGGWPAHAFHFWTKHGVVEDSCEPDTEEAERDFTCATKCSTQENYNASNILGNSYYVIENHAETIQREIFEYGSVATWFKVYDDFQFYDGGVYRPLANQTWDGSSEHAVRIIGWGEETGVPYWLVMNSWGPTWPYKHGDGSFKIVRGENLCEFEQHISAGIPRL